VNRTFVIAEAGVNHNGSLETALRLVDAAADAGADAIKFQTFKAGQLVTASAEKAAYQTVCTGNGGNQYDMLKGLELDEEAHEELISHCKRRGITFLSTPFDEDSLQLLAYRFSLPVLKISSGDITNGPLLLKAAMAGTRVILSTGIASLGEIEDALSVLAFGYMYPDGGMHPSRSAFRMAYCSPEGQRALQQNVTLLHCTTEYPCPYDEVNLRVIETLRRAFQLPIGLSDHTEGIAVSIAAVAMGASVIEKHFTLDRNMPGPDHKASIEPDELKQLVQSVRQVELAMGSSQKVPTSSELRNQSAVRKSLVAKNRIAQGEFFTAHNLTAKRPGTGVSPMYYWDYLDKRATRDYEVDEQVEE
jgi:N-acetylneuraminate synthase